jgi:putative inorganic carbon (HCO3(-)) transporter
VLRLVNGIALFYVLVNWVSTAGRVRLVYTGLIAAGIVLGVLAFFTVDWAEAKLPFIPASIYDRIPSLVADIVHPNVLGGTLLLAAPLAAAVVLWGGFRTGWWRVPAAAAVLWMGAVLVLSQSRGALLGFGVAVLILVALRWRWGWLGFVVALFALFWAVSAYGSLNLADLLFGSRVFGGIRGRTEIWGRGIFMVQDFPFTGIGMGLFPVVAERIYPFFGVTETTLQHAHNLFLQVGVDLGVPGMLAWLAVFLLVAWAGWRLTRSQLREAPPGLFRGIGAGILAVQVAVFVHGFFDAVVWGQVRSAPLVWVVWGFGMAVFTRRETPR